MLNTGDQKFYCANDTPIGVIISTGYFKKHNRLKNIQNRPKEGEDKNEKTNIWHKKSNNMRFNSNIFFNICDSCGNRQQLKH